MGGFIGNLLFDYLFCTFWSIGLWSKLFCRQELGHLVHHACYPIYEPLIYSSWTIGMDGCLHVYCHGLMGQRVETFRPQLFFFLSSSHFFSFLSPFFHILNALNHTFFGFKDVFFVVNGRTAKRKKGPCEDNRST